MKTNKNYKSNKIFIDELKRTFPIYILGMVFHAIVIYILYKIPSIIGNILDLLIKGNASKDIIMHNVYSLIFYSIIMIIPRIIYRTLFFTRARISDTYLRSKVIEHLQTVKPEYYDKEDKGGSQADTGADQKCQGAAGHAGGDPGKDTGGVERDWKTWQTAQKWDAGADRAAGDDVSGRGAEHIGRHYDCQEWVHILSSDQKRWWCSLCNFVGAIAFLSKIY